MSDPVGGGGGGGALPPPPPSDYLRGRSDPDDFTEDDFEDVYYHFDDYAQDVVLANASDFLTPPEPAEHYEWEEVILDEVGQSEWQGIKRSLCFGAGCGALGFGMLRWRRARGGFFRGVSKYASSSSSSSSTAGGRSAGGYTFDALPPTTDYGLHRGQHQFAGAGASGDVRSRLGLVVDATLSALLGLGTSLLAVESDVFYPATNRNGDDLSPPAYSIEPPPQWISPVVPLVPGRSVVAETLCRPLTEEFRKFPKSLWRSGRGGIRNGYDNHLALYANSGWRGTKYYRGNDNASVEDLGEAPPAGGDPAAGAYERLVRDSLQGFVINCERRARQERRLRKARGLRGDAPVVVPDSGVEADEDLSLSDIYREGDDEEEEEEEDGGGLGL